MSDTPTAPTRGHRTADQVPLRRERDERDSQRECAPLRVAEDAIVIDTEGITAEQVADKIIGFVQAETAVGGAS